jgi:chromosome segregation ATPase
MKNPLARNMDNGNQPDPPLPVQPFAPMKPQALSRARSEAAAQAAQHVHDLQTELEITHNDLTAAMNRIHLLDERVKMIQEDNDKLMRDRDYHKAEHTRIETSLRNAATLLVDIMRPIAPPDSSGVQAAVSGLEADLAK